MTRGTSKALPTAGRRAPIGVIFSEDSNDAESIKKLIKALWPSAPRIEYSRRPLILIKGQRDAEKRKKNAANVAAAIRAMKVRENIIFVIAHQDCDAVEPAHDSLRRSILEELGSVDVPHVIAVTPAWEMEAWWFLWPDAVAATNSKWKRLRRTGNHGMIRDAKEQLRRDLRHKSTRDYEESDSPRIAEQVAKLGLVARRTGFCASLDLFFDDISKLL